MARYPDALWRPLPENKTEPLITATQLILHSAVSGAESLYGYFSQTKVVVESHFYMQNDGDLEQYIDTARQADANYKASVRAISVETWDRREPDLRPWSAHQLEELAKLAAWAHRTHGVPLVRCAKWDSPGIGGHSDFPGIWTNVRGKTCPGKARKPQIDLIIRRARVLVGQATPIDEGDEEMLKRGDKGRGVAVFQTALNREADIAKRSGKRLTVDGDFGPATEARVREYQRAAQIPETGKIDAITAVLIGRYDPK